MGAASFMHLRSSFAILSVLLSFVDGCLHFLCSDTGKPSGVAVSYCISWYRVQSYHTVCNARYHGIPWGNRHPVLDSSAA